MKNSSIYKFNTLFKTQYANMLEYRAEIALWAISGVIPFFMLNIWTNNGLNESINISDVMLSRYFLSAFFVRQFSVVWVVFTFEEDALLGRVSPYIIQPLHPFIRYFAQHIAEQITRFPFALFIAIFFFIFNPQSLWVPSFLTIIISLLSVSLLTFLIIKKIIFYINPFSLIIVGISFPVLSIISRGQVEILIVCIALISLYCYKKDKIFLSANLIAILGFIKVFPLCELDDPYNS